VEPKNDAKRAIDDSIQFHIYYTFFFGAQDNLLFGELVIG
jgi:hypothetical protein